MKKLLYYTIALLPVGAIAQQKDSTSDAMTIDIIITQDGETQRISKELDVGHIKSKIKKLALDDQDLEVFIKELENLDVEGLRGFNNRVLLRTIDDAGEQVEVAYLGVSGHTQSVGEKKVVMLDRVLADSPAMTAGLLPGDVISQVDGKELSTYAALVEVIRGKKPGDKLELQINRQGKDLRLSIVLTAHMVDARQMTLQECEVRNMHHRVRRIPVEQFTELERQILTQKFGVKATAANRMDDADLELYPNPTEGLIKYELNLANGGAMSLSVFNKAGELVVREKLNDSKGSYRSEIDISEQPAGPYILVFEQNGKLLTQKILKN